MTGFYIMATLALNRMKTNKFEHERYNALSFFTKKIFEV